jgi:glucose-6-phosphate dehydrogenase assembly protein OpcA
MNFSSGTATNGAGSNILATRAHMSADLQHLSKGMPVEIGRIDRELASLWEASGSEATRASLINFAVYSEAPDSLERNNALLAALTREHACRAILIAARPSKESPRIQAWISAHCHITRAGARQVCSEQISFELSGKIDGLIPNIVFSHLDSDLPLYFWWQGEFADPLDRQLLDWADRFLFDSRDWQDPARQMNILFHSFPDREPRFVLCDLNWTRLIHFRLALAQVFDHPGARGILRNLKKVRIAYGKNSRVTALLFAGLFAAQLNWELEQRSNGDLQFALPDGTPQAALLLEEEGEGAMLGLRLETGQSVVDIQRAPCTDILHVHAELPTGEHWHQALPAGRDDLIEVVGEELMRGGSHALYLHSLRRIRGILCGGKETS